MIVIENGEACTIIGGSGDMTFSQELAKFLGRLIGRLARALYHMMTSKKATSAAG